MPIPPRLHPHARFVAADHFAFRDLRRDPYHHQNICAMPLQDTGAWTRPYKYIQSYVTIGPSPSFAHGLPANYFRIRLVQQGSGHEEHHRNGVNFDELGCSPSTRNPTRCISSSDLLNLNGYSIELQGGSVCHWNCQYLYGY